MRSAIVLVCGKNCKNNFECIDMNSSRIYNMLCKRHAFVIKQTNKEIMLRLEVIMERLKFYNVEDEYIEYLYQFDKKVPYNKNAKRPYIGIVLNINGNTYFAPMFSPKQQHDKYRASVTHIKIGKDLGIIKLNNMIPVNNENLKYIDFSDVQDKKYRNLLIQQNNFIQLNA